MTTILSIKQFYALLLLGAVIFSHTLPSLAQCSDNEAEVSITVNPDAYTLNETSWKLSSMGVTIDSMAAVSTVICVPADACLTFEIFDQEFNGIQGNNHYCEVAYNGTQVLHVDHFGAKAYTNFGNCPDGYACNYPISVLAGQSFIAPNADTWYTFQPDTSGIYIISSCNNSCATQIWIYEQCGNNYITNGPEGAQIFSTQGCGDQAQMTCVLQKNHLYYLRIGDENASCTGQSINWSLAFNGAVVGCMDPNACNYAPQATVSSGECHYPGDPECPDGPDLTINQAGIVSSLYLDQRLNNDNCFVTEGCMSGYGMRQLLRFTTHILNNGNQDYVIGEANASTGQFEFDPCHNHWHYEGYAEYLLYDPEGHELPVGFKNGFCVMDLECSNGGSAQYGCSYMGISAGCGDIYDAGLDCQWIDITDLPEGIYTLVVRVNWDGSPDMLGHYETDLSNNWAQTCILLSRNDITNQLSFSVVNNCNPYVDCAGQVYGNAQYDCMGVCGGNRLAGDIDNDGIRHTNDILAYANGILSGSLSSNNCNDLNNDNQVNIADIGLLTGCILQSTGVHTHGGGTAGAVHDHCILPTFNVVNINDTVRYSITNINPEEKYFDLAIQNPQSYVLDYQLQIDGVQLLGVFNLLTQPNYAPDYLYNAEGKIMCITISEQKIERYNTPTELLRIYYNNLTADEICVNVVATLNDNYEQTINIIEPNCMPALVFTGIEDPQNNPEATIATLRPNPVNNIATLVFSNPKHDMYHLEISDLSGKIVKTYSETTGTTFMIDRNKMPAGIYVYRIIGPSIISGKMMVSF